MTENIAETLRNKTNKAIERKANEAAELERLTRKEERASRRSQKKRVAQFVAEKLETTIADMMIGVHNAAEDGRVEIHKTWRIIRDNRDPKPKEELDKHRTLRDEVGKHFTGIGLLVGEIDYRETYEDRTYGSDEGWYPTVLGDHIVGLTVSWDEVKE